MLHSLRILSSVLTLLFLLAACAPAAPATTDAPAQDKRLRVVVSILPIANIVYNIGGDRIDLDAIMPPGADPHTFEPRPSDAVKLSQADLIFVNGMHLDETTLKLAQANLKDGAEIIELAAKVASPDELIYGQEHHHGDAHDDDDDDHATATVTPTTMMTTSMATATVTPTTMMTTSMATTTMTPTTMMTTSMATTTMTPRRR